MQFVNNPINEEALVSRLLHRATTTVRFRLPMPPEQAVRLLSAAVKAEVEYRSRRFEATSEVTSHIQAISSWLTNPGSKFGMLLCGGVGNGKSTFVKAFQQLLNQLCLRSDGCRDYWKIRIVDARTIAHLCKSDYAAWEELSRIGMLAIDDLGTEPVEIQDYGNILAPIVDLLSRRYDRQLFTIVTTNLQPREIRSRYGDRIADRFNEMMHKIVFGNHTFRTAA